MSSYDIAIVGMGCVFPEANNTTEYWENIISGKQFIKDMPDKLWPMDSYTSNEKNDYKSYTKVGSFIKDFEFNAFEYGIPPKNLEGVDRAQLVGIEATRQALVDAGIKPKSKELEDAITVIGGSGVDEYAHVCTYINRQKFFKKFKPHLEKLGLNEKQKDELFEEFTQAVQDRGHTWNPAVSTIGSVISSVPNRIAQVFGVKNFNMSVDGACGSSFVALSVACKALLAGDAKIAIAGGVDLGINPPIYVGFSKLGGLSKDGKPNPFDKDANGLTIGEGGGVVVLKRLEDALANGDEIKAVIKGLGSTSDGAGQAIYNPSAKQRSIAMKKALDSAEIKAKDIQFLEAHATSTVVGDANEYDAISMVYGGDREGRDPLNLGTVKYQIGHLKAAAGIAGLIKTVLAMNHKKIPHMPDFRELTPHAKGKSSSLLIPNNIQEWMPLENGSKYAAVTTSGFGGVNYHTILEQAPTYTVAKREKVDRKMAIVGVSCRVPGANDAETFWKNISTGKNQFFDVDPVKMKWEDNYRTGPETEQIKTDKIALIDDAKVDFIRHKISPKSVSQISPAQLLSVEVADQLLSDYGYTIKENKNIGISLGSMHDDNYADIFFPLNTDEYIAALRQTKTIAKVDQKVLQSSLEQVAKDIIADGPPHTEATLPGWMSNINAGIIANRLNCTGPNFTVDTACSSGLASFLPAMYQLMFTDTNMMIAGGLNRHTSSPFVTAVGTLGAMAENTAAPFDERGDGFLAGEGGVLYLLKRYADAKKDGDKIHGIIHNVSGSSEYAQKNMVAPSEHALRHSIHQGLKDSGIAPEKIGIVDTHGSGNKLSDILEAQALAKELRPDPSVPPVHITAIKSHIGHLYGGSGASSVLSVLESLRAKQVPGIQNLVNIRPEISDVLDRVQPQIGTVPLSDQFTAGAVNSLGLGGANYFGVITLDDQDKGSSASEGKSIAAIDLDGVFVCNAESNADLLAQLENVVKTGDASGTINNGSEICFTVSYENDAALKQKLNQAILFLKSNKALKPLLAQGVYLNNKNKEESKLAFCFPGQGTHYIGMGKDLYASNAEFKAIVDKIDSLSKARFNFDVLKNIYGGINEDAANKELSSLEGAQISLFAIEVGVAKVLHDMGIKPEIIIGHSFGEISALASQGAWSLENAFEVVAARIDAAKLGSKSGNYKMMSVICTDEQKDALLEFAGDNVVLSNTNAPGQFILAGVEADIIKTSEAADTLGYEPKILQIGSAFHSKFMEVAVEPFRKEIEKLACNPVSTPILSTITGNYITYGNSSDLAKHLAKQLTTPINMPRDINRLYNDGVTQFLEVGPRWALTKMIEATLENKNITAVPTLHPKVGDVETFRRALAYLVSIGRIGNNTGGPQDGLLGDSAFIEYLKNNEPAVLALIDEAQLRFNGGYKPQVVKTPVVTKAAPVIANKTEAKVAFKPIVAKTQSKTLDISTWVTGCTNAIAETTGYPSEMLGADLDLEADLGIDSVQRAEIWGTMVNEHDLDKEYRPEQIRTINELATELAKLAGTYTETAAPVTQSVTKAVGKVDVSTWVAECTAAIAETTGYPSEMLGADLDLEADLGIDSVQRAEIWGTMVNAHDLDKEYRPVQIRTINELAGELAQLAGPSETVVSPAAQPVATALSTVDISTWVTECTTAIAETTGYPAEMLGADLDLEADLGIDSVQRAEIWGSMVNAHDLDKEYRPVQIRTINELAGELAQLANPSGTTVAPVAVAKAAGVDISTWVAECTTAIAETTGYPAEMLGADLDLEADLGIDSVQRAEIWGGMVNTHDLDKEYRPVQIRTINELAGELAQLAAPTTAVAIAAPGTSKASGADISTWVKGCTEAIAETTGYPAEMLGADLDLEADLGIDSVQRAEIWGGMVNTHDLDKEYRPEQIRTINELAGELAKLSGSVKEGTTAVVSDDSKASVSNQVLSDEVNNYLFNCETKALKAYDIKAFKCEKVLAIVADAKEKTSWTTKLKKLNKETSIVTVPEVLELDEKTIAGADTILVLFHQKLYKQTLAKLQPGLSNEVIKIYNVFRKISSVFETKPGRIICPISQDGAFGNERKITNLMGSFPAGFIRSLQFEYPEVKFQLVDAGDAKWEEVIAKSIDVAFPQTEVGYLNGKWNVPVMRKSDVQAKANKVLAKNDLVLVTGGARGIVFECVFELAKRTGCSLLVTGRSELMDQELPWMSTSADKIDQVIREMEISLVKDKGMNLGEAKREGAKCKSQWEIHNNFKKLEENNIKYTYRKCDVSDKAALTALIKEFSDKDGIKGIVHGAGVQRSKLLNQLSDDAIMMALNTKMEPLFVFAEQIDFSKLKLLSAFGSIAGLFGNAGQSDYALANDLLACSVAYLGQEHKVFSQTIEWTAWAGIGMVTAAEEKRFAESGLNPLVIETGTKLYGDAILNTKLNRVAAFNKGANLINSRPISIGAIEDYMIDRLADKSGKEVSFSLEKDVYLHQHLVQGRTVVPGTFSTEIFAEAIEGQDKLVQNIKFRRPLWVREEGFTVEVVESDNKLLLLPKQRPAMVGKALENLSFAVCETGDAKSAKTPTIPKVAKTVITELNKIAKESNAPFYSRLDDEFSGALKSGKIFRGVLSTLTKGETLYSLLEFTDEAADLFALEGKFVINPVIADMAVQALASITMQAHNVMAIPYGIGEMQVFNQSSDRKIIIVCKNAELSDDETKADVFAIEESGKPLFYMKGMVLKAIAKSDK